MGWVYTTHSHCPVFQSQIRLINDLCKMLETAGASVVVSPGRRARAR
jgi:hypothetical protein